MCFHNFIISFLVLCYNVTFVNGQHHAPKKSNHTILGSFHFSNYFENNEYANYSSVLGVGIEYRNNIKNISDRFYLSLGVGIESIPIKRNYENEDYYIDKEFNVTVPFGIYSRFSKGYYVGMYTSIDIPFATGENSMINGMEFKHTELYFNRLNINVSAGINIGKRIKIGNSHVLIEGQCKMLALLGLKSNDYWHYAEDTQPYYWGWKMGYSF